MANIIFSNKIINYNAYVLKLWIIVLIIDIKWSKLIYLKMLKYSLHIFKRHLIQN